MERFKKKGIILIIASVITISSAFCAGNFKNSVMSIDFESGTNGAVNAVINTKSQYLGEISPIQKDSTTFVIMLPETDSNINQTNITKSANIENVEIKTLPYTTNGKGYTKITIKTHPNTTIYGQNKIYIPKKNNLAEENYQPPNSQTSTIQTEQEENTKQNYDTQNDNTNAKTESETIQTDQQNNVENNPLPQTEKQSSTQNTNSNNQEIITFILCVLLIMAVVIFIFLRAKNKMEEISGPRDNNEEEEKKEEKINTQKPTIKQKIDKLNSQIPKTNTYTPIKTYTSSFSENKNLNSDDIIDLDDLYTEHTNMQNNETEEDEEDYLMTFLESEVTEITSEKDTNKRTEDETIEKAFAEENNKKMEMAYQELIKNDNLRFSQEDIEKINELINNEISNEVLNNIQEYITVTSPIKPAYSKEKILEDLITTYSISCNVVFTQEDCNILKQLMNVELSSDFITDLKTNPQTTQRIEQEIIQSQVITPPDEIKSQPSKPEKIIVDTELANIDFSKYSINNQQKSEEKFQYVDNTFKVDVLDTTNLDLPDLEDAKNNPDKYYVEPEIFVPDEKVLEERILNVTFKPFFEETETSEDNNNDKTIVNDTPVSDTTDAMPMIATPAIETPMTDTENNISENTSDMPVPEKVIEETPKINIENTKNTEKVITQTTDIQVQSNNTTTEQNFTKYVFRNKVYMLKSSTTFDEKSGCHLLYHEQDGYIVMAYSGEHMEQINAYPELTSTKIQARLSKTLPDGTQQYIIRIGTQKFIIEKYKSQIKYVLDLC